MPVDPDASVELAMLGAGAPCVIGCDEVGRGALAGPVAVGAAAFWPGMAPWPAGVRDSKALSAARREALDPEIRAWTTTAVGLASPAEIDELGITTCLGLAARRALAELFRAGVPVGEATVLLDGDRDWIAPVLTTPLRVLPRVRADRDCVSVAAASVVAKVERDRAMTEAAEAAPAYAWERNKGYGSQAHLAAIAEHGPTALHRRTWLRSRA